MRKTILPLLLLIHSISSRPQTSGTSYSNDLEALHSILQKTASYKDQIKGQSLDSFNNLYEDLLRDTVASPSDYHYFYNLCRLIFPLRDNHLGFYQFSNIGAGPRFNGNIDSLQAVLADVPPDSVEGIYHYDKYYSVGLVKTAEKEFTGVILTSTVSAWKPGEIVIHLYEYRPGYFKAIYSHPRYRYYIYYPAEKYLHHSLANSFFHSSFTDKVYSKTTGLPDFINLPRDIYDFHFRELEPGIQYLHIKHFSADPVDMQKSAAFYDSIQHSLTAPSLILDLRNNNGGAEKVSKKFLSLIKKYSKKGKVYVLVNNGTISQGEIFTLELKQLSNITVLGQTTRGMLAYGNNYGKREKLPSQAFEVYITDMRNGRQLLPYEGFGITPDIGLAGDRDWIEQALEIIRNK